MLITVCDVCQDRTKPAKTYEVREVDTGRVGEIALCADDSKGVQWTRTQARRRTPAKKTTAAPRKGRSIAILTPEEIEALKSS